MGDEKKLLWLSYLNGNNEALQSLYPSFFLPLRYAALYHVKQKNVADDLVHDVLLILLEASPDQRNQWKSIARFDLYVQFMLRNKCMDFLRKKNRTFPTWMFAPSAHAIHQAQWMFDEYCQKVLSENQSQIFNLHIQGFDNHEIASKNNISEKTVRNQLSLSKQKLRRLWIPCLLFMTNIW
ncbi:MAG: hypothetical protein RL106_1189 [Bacteroidota bacterium]|jgi:RNA polymerase sigma factor (sigma-70 family)